MLMCMWPLITAFCFLIVPPVRAHDLLRSGRAVEWREKETGACSLRLRILAVINCDDVRIDCLRNVIETRAFASYGVHDVQARPTWGSSAFERHVDKQENTPCRIEIMQVERCEKVTEGGMRLLESLPGAPEFVYKC